MPFNGDDPLSGDPPPVSSSASGQGPSPIGVPREYQVPRPSGHTWDEHGFAFLQPVDPYDDPERTTYYDGDEYIPSNYPAAQIWTLQQALAKVGLLTGSFTRNTWDNTTRIAYKELLAIANAQGLSADQALQELLATGGIEGGGQFTVDSKGNIIPIDSTSSRAPLVVRKTDPAALRQLFRRSVIDMLGEGWSQEDIDKLVASYHKVEEMKQHEAYALAETGGTAIDQPSPEAFIQAEVLKRDPVGVQSQEALGFVDEFMNLANSPAWSG